MNDVITKEKILIEKLIYEVRGKHIMLDSEVAVIKCHRNYNKEGSNQ